VVTTNSTTSPTNGNLEISPYCSSGCQEIENNTHILIECPQSASARNPLIDFLVSQKLPLDVPTITGLNYSIPNPYRT
jgi:hypothetical protein